MTTQTDQSPAAARTRGNPVFSSLIGVSALAIFFQAVWAGLFLEHDGARDKATTALELHARGSEVALLFAVLATAYAVWKLRSRRDLWIGGAVLVVLLLVESFLGGQIKDAGADSLTVIHIPLAMGIMGLAVWLPFRARRKI